MSNSKSSVHILWGASVLLLYTVFFFAKVSQPDFIFTGDTLNSFSVYSYHYSGFARGEYPIWNPLVRTGQAETLHQVFLLANPICNIVAAVSALSGMKDIVFSFSVLIFVLVLVYAIGVCALVSCWTDNRDAGIFAMMIALGSSTVLWVLYHISFILIVHAVPWMIYATAMYIREFKFKYLVIFALALNSALYSYQYVMGLSYIIMLSVAAIIIYYKQVTDSLHKLEKIPVWHILALGGIMLIMIFPAILMFLEFREKLLPISRATGIILTDQYDVIYQTSFIRSTHAVPQFWFPQFWATLFTGIFNNTYEELRLYVGPLSFSVLIVALISRRRSILCIALSGLLILLLAKNIFPANILYKFPVFSLIRNGHFLLQFFLLVIIILAGFGFDLLIKGGAKKIFNSTAAFVILISLILLCQKSVSSVHNNTALSILSISMLLILLAVNYLSRKFMMASFLTFATINVLTSALLFNRLPMSGGIINDPTMSAIRQRSDHSLHFRSERPVNIDTFKMPYSFSTDMGEDEFSSYITLKDNSYKTYGRNYGASSFPLVKSYYLFMSLPGHEQIMRRKFFFFNKCYTSLNPADMIAFKRDAQLLDAMLARRLGVVDQLNASDVSLGPFQPESVKAIPVETEENAFHVGIIEYKANSIRMTVSVDQSGLFTYTDLWDKGWRVKLDGKAVPLRKVFHTFKGVELSPGIHEVEFHYLSKALVSILIMNIVFIFCSLGLVVHFVLASKDNYKKERVYEF